MQMNNILIGTIAGSTLMFLLDPAAGRRRRALMRDQIRKARRRSRKALEATTRDISNRSGGVTATIRRLWASETANDRRLIERVRATLGHSCSHPRAIDVEADNGHVILRGPVLGAEEQSLLRAVAGVPGLKGVRNGLEAHASSDGVSAFQGHDRLPQQRPGMLPLRWSLTTCAMITAALVASGVWIPRTTRGERVGTEYAYGSEHEA
jgi:hypothetical protein